MTTAKIIEYGVELAHIILDLVGDAIEGPEPPTLEELHARIEQAIATHKDGWLEAEKMAANEAADASADAAFKQ